jgi:hypothetical protein
VPAPLIRALPVATDDGRDIEIRIRGGGFGDPFADERRDRDVRALAMKGAEREVEILAKVAQREHRRLVPGIEPASLPAVSSSAAMSPTYLSFLPNPAMPEPVGHPDRGNTGGLGSSGRPNCTGGGETDWTLEALHTAAASLAGPGTSLLVGIAPGGTPRARGNCSRTSPRSRALASRAVSDCSPKVDSMNFRVEVCSKGPS